MKNTAIMKNKKEVGCFYIGKKKFKEKKWRWLEKEIPLHFLLLFLFCFFGAVWLIFENPDFFKNDKSIGLASVVSPLDSDSKENLDSAQDIKLQPLKLPLSNNIFYGLPLSPDKEKPQEKPKNIRIRPSQIAPKSNRENSSEAKPAQILQDKTWAGKDGKYIEVDIGKQVMAIYGSGELKGLYKVSTGMPGYRTPTGNFKVLRKSANVWSQACQCWMPYAMEFKSSLFIHELPYWPGKGREGEAHLGRPVSHGCVRLGIGPAKEVYEFADIGTPVIIHN